MENIAVIENHFKNLLYPRNHGLIGIVDLKPASLGKVQNPPRPADSRGLLITMGYTTFMEVVFETDSIPLYFGYPGCFLREDRQGHFVENWGGTVQTLPSRPQDRHQVLSALAESRVRVVQYTTRFDLSDPDSLNLAEFVIQTTISRVRGLVCQKAGRMTLRDDAYFNDPFAFAIQDYARKAVRKAK